MNERIYSNLNYDVNLVKSRKVIFEVVAKEDGRVCHSFASKQDAIAYAKRLEGWRPMFEINKP